MPNIKSWTISEFVTFAKMANIKYNINGYGKIVDCSASIGEPIDINSTIEIYLEDKWKRN